MRKIFVVLVLAVTAALLMSACSVFKVDPGVSAYVVDNASKVLQDQSIESSSNSLNVSLAKNEYEGMQFILNSRFSDFKVKSVSVSALRHENGTDFIPADNMTVYRQHYMYVDVHYHTYTGYPDAYYPDALIETKYDDSVHPDGFSVSANKNQGYWITVYSDKNQCAGKYTGEVTVVTDINTLVIPVECTVYDFAISEDVHFKTYYGLWDVNNYDSQMVQYYEFFKKYRMSSWRLPVEDKASEEEYLNAAQTYATGNDITTYFLNLNGRRGWVEDPEQGRIYKFNQDFITLTDKLNQITPGKVYVLTHDEPENKGDLDPGSENFWANDVEWFTGIANNDLPNVKTMVTHDNFLPAVDSAAGFIRYVPDAWCIKPSNMLEGDVEDLHANGKELWWYTCNWPVYPALNTHIDSYLVAARLLTWMSYDYDIDGYFCWCATAAGRATDAEHTDDNIWINPYAYLTGTGRGDPAGDNYIVLQGREGDGIINENVPVPTIRLEAMRDGMEDYEYLYIYEQKINEIISELGADIEANDVMQMFYDALYNSTINFDTDTGKLMFTRNDLAEKICEDVDFVYYITRGNENYDFGKRDIFVYSDGTQPVSINGVEVQGDNGRYCLTVDIDETAYRNDFEIKVGDKTVYVYCYPDVVSENIVLADISGFVDDILYANRRITVEVEGDSLIAYFTDKSRRVAFPFEALTGVSDYSPYTHIRIKMETADGQDIPSGSMTCMAKSAANTVEEFESFPSGAYIDIPISSEFITITQNSPSRIWFSFSGKDNITVILSDVRVIHKDVQDPELTESGLYK